MVKIYFLGISLKLCLLLRKFETLEEYFLIKFNVLHNQRIFEIFIELKSFSLHVEVTDPYASSEELHHEYGFTLTKEIGSAYDAIIITVPHNEYKELTDQYFASLTKEHALIADLKGTFRGKITSRSYWSL